jgi:hypothetical protein
MEESALTTTITWLAPSRRPLLVQLTRADYGRMKSAWGLP